MSPAGLECFRHEARRAAKLRHPKIVSVHEVGQAEGRDYLEMHLMLGNAARLGIYCIETIARSLAAGMQAAPMLSRRIGPVG